MQKKDKKIVIDLKMLFKNNSWFAVLVCRAIKVYK